MIEGPKQAPAAVHAQVSGRPNDGGAGVRGEDRILGGDFIQRRSYVLRMKRLARPARASQIVQAGAVRSRSVGAPYQGSYGSGLAQLTG